MRKGFTIIELLASLAIIAVLATIVVISARGAIRESRSRRADAMRVALEQAVSAYYAQTGSWPREIEEAAQGSDEESKVFSPSETDGIFQQVVGKGFGKDGTRSILVDASALFVADSSRLGNSGWGCNDNHSDRRAGNYCGDQRCISGVDFSIAANRNNRGAIPFSRMSFGYQGPENGKFCRFRVVYHTKTDSVTVTR